MIYCIIIAFWQLIWRKFFNLWCYKELMWRSNTSEYSFQTNCNIVHMYVWSKLSMSTHSSFPLRPLWWLWWTCSLGCNLTGCWWPSGLVSSCFLEPSCVAPGWIPGSLLHGSHTLHAWLMQVWCKAHACLIHDIDNFRLVFDTSWFMMLLYVFYLWCTHVWGLIHDFFVWFVIHKCDLSFFMYNVLFIHVYVLDAKFQL